MDVKAAEVTSITQSDDSISMWDKLARIWKKVMAGTNFDGSMKEWKAGDSRGDFSAALNTISGLTIYGCLALVCSVYHFWREGKWDRAAKSEIVRMQEYKEVFWIPLRL